MGRIRNAFAVRRAQKEAATEKKSGTGRRRAASKKPPSEGPKRNRRTRPKASEAPAVEEAPKPPMKERLKARAGAMREAVGRLKRPVELAARALVVVAIGVGAVALGRLVERHVRTSPSFAVTEIGLEGHVRLTRGEILSVAGLEVGQNVFDVAPEEVTRRLEAHPWIAEAEVARRLPGTYAIEVRERRAVALLALGDVYLVGDDGSVFKRVEDDDPLDLPVVTGVERARFTRDRGFRTSILLEVVALLHDYRGAGLWRREPIGEIHVEADGGLSLFIGDDAMLVRLGHGPFRAKLGRLRTVLDELGERGARAAYVYLDNERRPDRVTVRLREHPVSPEAEAPTPEPASEGSEA